MDLADLFSTTERMSWDGWRSGGAAGVRAVAGCISGKPEWGDGGSLPGGDAIEGADACGGVRTAQAKPCAARVRAAPWSRKYRAEGASDGHQHVGGWTVLSEDDDAARHAESPGGAHAGGGGGDLPRGAAISQRAAGGVARGRAADIAGECAVAGVSGVRQ